MLLPAFPLRPHACRTCRPLLLSISAHSSAPAAALDLDATHPTYMIWGANTGVGKTLVSAGLAAAVLRSAYPAAFLYLKPLQTGFPLDSDARFVLRRASALSSPLLASHHVLRASPLAARDLPGASRPDPEADGRQPNALCWYEETRVGEGYGDRKLVCKTLYGWREAVSPHLVAEREEMAVGDAELRETLRRCLMSGLGEGTEDPRETVWKVIETAGGVASPGSSGTLQCDLYRPFRLPAVLVGDGRLGGISATISAYESLKLRGYDVVAVILIDHGLANEGPLSIYLRNRVRVLVLPPVPQDPSNNLMDWFCESSEVFRSLQELMQSTHSERIRRLHEMPKKAGQVFWWPFTQHQLVPEEIVTVIDSRFAENFTVHKVCNNQEMMIPQFDACASWWTQGPDATMQIELARDMGYSAARYGHVMFPENVYEPALQCAEVLLEGVGSGWATRAFFSDNGSTAIEIALKMAFRKFSFDHGICMEPGKTSIERSPEFRVLALNGSYHGDTLGAMEAQAPSSYTSFLQQPWYSGRGLFLDPPTAFICCGSWVLSLPNGLLCKQMKNEEISFSTCDELFCWSRESSTLARSYFAYISRQLSQFSESNYHTHIGALIIEPVIQAAGGMHMIDPLFQRILVKECQIRRIPVIYDEVFTGFWRLGKESAAELLGCKPDVACYAKLMTGGIVPLAVTLTTEDVFRAFTGDSKLKALLHGHSYSAHAMGCTAAAKAIQWFKDPSMNPNIDLDGKNMIELWDMRLVLDISSHPAVKRIIAMGTLCAIELSAEGSDSGYASLYARSLVQQLREDGLYMRPLGNVIYLMCGPCTPPHVCNKHLNKVYQRICEFSENQEKESRVLSSIDRH